MNIQKVIEGLKFEVEIEIKHEIESDTQSKSEPAGSISGQPTELAAFKPRRVERTVPGLVLMEQRSDKQTLLRGRAIYYLSLLVHLLKTLTCFKPDFNKASYFA